MTNLRNRNYDNPPLPYYDKCLKFKHLTLWADNIDFTISLKPAPLSSPPSQQEKSGSEDQNKQKKNYENNSVCVQQP